jgi:hypothetical protein
MKSQKIADKTLKEIFEDIFGKENTEKILNKIQVELDKGIRGEDLKKIAKIIIEEVTGHTGKDSDLGTIPIAITSYNHGSLPG